MTRLRHTARRFQASLALAGIVLLGAAGSAAAGSYPIARFWANIAGHQTTTWNDPYFIAKSWCFGKAWNEANGNESLDFTTGRVKVMVERFGRLTFWRWGSWQLAGGGSYIHAPATWTRESDTQSGTDPGPCGGVSQVDPAPLQTCGTRHVKLTLSLDPNDGNRLTIADMVFGPGQKPFSCNEFTPPGAQPTWTPLPLKLPASELFDRRIGKEVALAHQHFSFHAPSTARPSTITTNVRWQITLTRAG